MASWALQPIPAGASNMHGPPPSPAFLFAQFFDTFHFWRHHAGSDFNPLDQFPTGQKSIHRLAPFPHAGDHDTGRRVFQLNAARRLVDMLAAVARRSDEVFLQILLANAQLGHFYPEPAILFFTYGEFRHDMAIPAVVNLFSTTVENTSVAP